MDRDMDRDRGVQVQQVRVLPPPHTAPLKASKKRDDA
jgi:hypothetical protein